MWWGRMDNMFKKYSEAPEETLVADKPCKGKHRDHVCAMAARADFQEIAAAAAKPNYVCMNCGRVADVADNLCNPMTLSAVAIGLPHPA